MTTLIRFWPAIFIGLAVLNFALWQGQVKGNGKLQERLTYQTSYSAGLKNQLDEANAKIKATARQGAIAYGQCQDVIMNDATQSFDRGVTFGRATCPKP